MTDDDDLPNQNQEATPRIWDALKTWSQQLPDWQRFIIVNAVRHKNLSDDLINDAYQIFLRHAGLDDGAQELPDIPEFITGQDERDSTAPLSLVSIQNLQNVNAISNGSGFPIDPNLTLVYGDNGSGKSGFVRVLSAACFSRSDVGATILPNIYANDALSVQPSAEIVFKKGNEPEEVHHIPGTSESAALKRISVFDSVVARVHLTEENPLSFQPRGFDVFDEMVRVFGAIVKLLDADISKRPTENIFNKAFVDQGHVAQAVSEINEHTNLHELRKLSVFGKPEISRLKEIDQQRQNLAANSPVEMINMLSAAKKHIQEVQSEIESFQVKFGAIASNQYRVLLEELERALIERAHFAGGEEQHQSLTEIGSSLWVRFIEAVQNLSSSKKDSYPEIDDPCLLCHRPLDEASATLIRKFFTFLDHETHASVGKLQQQISEMIVELQQFCANLSPERGQRRADLARTVPEVLRKIDGLSEVFISRQNDIIRALVDKTHHTLPSSDVNVSAAMINDTLSLIDEKINNLSKGDFNTVIAQLKQEHIDLRHRQVLSQNIDDICKYVQDICWVSKANQQKKTSLSTRVITTKEKEFFQLLIKEQYKNSLKDECEELGFPLPIELHARGVGGQTHLQLKIKGEHLPDKIFSEGEQRVLALADFLTEINLNPTSAGIIFDDPVTSMDHLRKQKIAKRLVKESVNRQIIVFTHDLVFVNALLARADKINANIKTHWVGATDNISGILSHDDCPVDSKGRCNTEKARESLAEAKAAKGRSRVELVEKGANALRCALEEIIVFYLFKQTVRRWNEQIHVGALAKINWDQTAVDKIIDIYNEISKIIPAHSHSVELMEIPPTPDQLENLINQVDAVKNEVKRDRKKPTRVAEEKS